MDPTYEFLATFFLRQKLKARDYPVVALMTDDTSFVLRHGKELQQQPELLHAHPKIRQSLRKLHPEMMEHLAESCRAIFPQL